MQAAKPEGAAAPQQSLKELLMRGQFAEWEKTLMAGAAPQTLKFCPGPRSC